MTTKTKSHPLRIAVIGAGPAGFYVAEALLKQAEYVSVDLFDRCPTPYGLVRFGVAPDHLKIKSITLQYEKIANDPRVRFLGNVELGRDLHHSDLKKHYDAIFYTTGASQERRMGIQGEHLQSSHSATEFVSWYNGHPDAADAHFDLDVTHAAVIGAGNVALDVARMLVKSPKDLESSDMAEHALSALRESKITDLYLIARRGVVQAKFTTKELRELAELPDVDFLVDPSDMELDVASQHALEHSDNVIKKNVEFLTECSKRTPQGKPRRIHLKFLSSPKAILGTDRVNAVRIERTTLDAEQRVVGTGHYEDLAVGLVLSSVGYKGAPLPGVPFDERLGIVPNQKGRIVTLEGHVVPGEYVAGWIKRGPSGVVGSNKICARESVERFLEDLPKLPRVSFADAHPRTLTELLDSRNIFYVTFDQWLELDHLEKEAGQRCGRPRVKMVRVEEMLSHLRKPTDL